MDVEDVKKLTVEKLKPELKSRGLDTSGKKADLVERLEAYLKSNSAEGKEPAQTGPASSTGDEEVAKPTTTQTRESIVWNPAPSTSAPADNPETSEPTTTENTKSQEELETEKRQARAAKFGTSGASAAQESGKRKLDDTGADKISADDLVSDEQQAKRRERFLTQEQKEAAAAKEEEAKRKAERISRFHPDEAKKVDRSQRFQQWLGSDPTTAAPAAASANGKPAGDKITAAINSSLDQSAKLLGKGPKAKGGSGKGGSGKGGSGKGASNKSAAAAPAETKYSDEFKAKADARKARFAGKS